MTHDNGIWLNTSQGSVCDANVKSWNRYISEILTFYLYFCFWLGMNSRGCQGLQRQGLPCAHSIHPTKLLYWRFSSPDGVRQTWWACFLSLIFGKLLVVKATWKELFCLIMSGFDCILLERCYCHYIAFIQHLNEPNMCRVYGSLFLSWNKINLHQIRLSFLELHIYNTLLATL